MTDDIRRSLLQSLEQRIRQCLRARRCAVLSSERVTGDRTWRAPSRRWRAISLRRRSIRSTDCAVDASISSSDCSSAILEAAVIEHRDGVDVRRITSQRELRSFAIPVPSAIPEQRAIATALSDVDALLGGLDRLIAKKRDLKQAAMQQLLTGQTRLPGFHGEWEVKRLGDIVSTRFADGMRIGRSTRRASAYLSVQRLASMTSWIAARCDRLSSAISDESRSTVAGCGRATSCSTDSVGWPGGADDTDVELQHASLLDQRLIARSIPRRQRDRRVRASMHSLMQTGMIVMTANGTRSGQLIRDRAGDFAASRFRSQLSPNKPPSPPCSPTWTPSWRRSKPGATRPATSSRR